MTLFSNSRIKSALSTLMFHKFCLKKSNRKLYVYRTFIVRHTVLTKKRKYLAWNKRGVKKKKIKNHTLRISKRRLKRSRNNRPNRNLLRSIDGTAVIHVRVRISSPFLWFPIAKHLFSNQCNTKKERVLKIKNYLTCNYFKLEWGKN